MLIYAFKVIYILLSVVKYKNHSNKIDYTVDETYAICKSEYKFSDTLKSTPRREACGWTARSSSDHCNKLNSSPDKRASSSSNEGRLEVSGFLYKDHRLFKYLILNRQSLILIFCQ